MGSDFCSTMKSRDTEKRHMSFYGLFLSRRRNNLSFFFFSFSFPFNFTLPKSRLCNFEKAARGGVHLRLKYRGSCFRGQKEGIGDVIIFFNLGNLFAGGAWALANKTCGLVSRLYILA